MKTIVVANLKGGVGKTTSVIDISAALTAQGKKVLIIDLDQSMNLSAYLQSDASYKTINEVLRVECPITDAIQHKEDFDLIASSPALSRADRDFIDAEDPFLLADVIDILDKDETLDYDYVVVDNSASRTILLTMAYIAADYIVIPTDCDDASLKGVRAIYEDVKKLRTSRHAFSHAKILGIIITRAKKRTSVFADAKEMMLTLAASIPEKPFVMEIREASVVTEAKKLKIPIRKRRPKSNPAMDYEDVVREIVARIEAE